MLIETEKMIPITKLQKQLTQKIREISDNNETIYILKNNKMEAVLLSFEDYEHLKEIEEIVEHFEIDEVINNRLKNYDPNTNISFNDLIKKY